MVTTFRVGYGGWCSEWQSEGQKYELLFNKNNWKEQKERERSKEEHKVQGGYDLFKLRAFHIVWKKKVTKQNKKILKVYNAGDSKNISSKCSFKGQHIGINPEYKQDLPS